eukprot:1793378-Amphidinium_carterae.1
MRETYCKRIRQRKPQRVEKRCNKKGARTISKSHVLGMCPRPLYGDMSTRVRGSVSSSYVQERKARSLPQSQPKKAITLNGKPTFERRALEICYPWCQRNKGPQGDVREWLY